MAWNKINWGLVSGIALLAPALAFLLCAVSGKEEQVKI